MLANPLTGPIIYLTGFVIGHWLFGVWPHGPDALRYIAQALIGTCILAVVCGIVAFVVAWGVAVLIRRRWKAT